MIVYLKRYQDNYQLHLSILDLLGNVLNKDELIVKQITKEEILNFITNNAKTDSKISLIVISIPGICHDGMISVCDYPCLENTDLELLINQQLDIKVIIENDVNVACIGFSNDYQGNSNIALVYQPSVE